MRFIVINVVATALLLCAVSLSAASDSPETFQVQSPFDDLTADEECPVNASEVLRNLNPVFELMKQDPELAAACAVYLDARQPEWHHEDGAQELVEPFLDYLLGDGIARGMNRHADFINLLGHLQKIAPDWRLRDEVDAILEKAIIESVAQDPFVADFWRSAIDEGHLGWQESFEAESVMPVIYELAVEQQQRTDGLINERPKSLLKELSWPSYAKLILATRVFDTWPKRVLVFAFALMILLFAVRFLRRRRAT